MWRQRERGLPAQLLREHPLAPRPQDLHARSPRRQAAICRRHRNRHPSRLPLPQADPRLATVVPTLDGHADQIRSSISDVMGASSAEEESSGAITVAPENSGALASQPSGAGATPRIGTRSSASARRGPSVHRYNIGTWTAYHAARIAAGSIAGASRRSADQD